jgi:hypothetical protein
MASNQPAPAYPVRFSIDYPDHFDRLTSAFRIIWAIPILFVLGMLGNGAAATLGNRGFFLASGAGGGLFLATVAMLLFRQKYPRWWFDWLVELSRLGARVSAYCGLLVTEYPSVEEHQSVHLEIDYPDAAALSRGLPLVKWFLAIPHYFVLFFLLIAVFAVTVIAWFAILFTGAYPRGMWNFAVGVNRWLYRVYGYAFWLVTDQYPPFSLSE